MVINGTKLLELAPILNMIGTKEEIHGTSYGLSEAGYDIRIKQNITFQKHNNLWHTVSKESLNEIGRNPFIGRFTEGKFIIASAIEEFQMPTNLVGIVHDKSTWARKGLSVLNTCIEPGWNGFLTLELVYHGQEDLIIPAGSGIAQVIFHELVEHRSYGPDGKYQDQPNHPVEAKS